MDENQKKLLAEAGIDTAMALNNFMNNEAMLTKFLGKYVTEKSFPALAQTMESGDREAAKMAAHTHKSVCGTLGCVALNKMIVDQEQAMRAEDWTKANEMMPEILAEHDKIVNAIKSCGF